MKGKRNMQKTTLTLATPIGRAMCGAAIVAAALVIGCGGTGYRPADTVATYRIDTVASEVSLRQKSGAPISPEVAGPIRASIGEILNNLVADRSDVMNAVPARFRADVVRDQRMLGFIVPCMFQLGLIGCPCGWIDFDVDLTIEIAGRRFVGKGHSSRASSYYYNFGGGASLRGIEPDGFAAG